ncbi:isocitrate lyase/PEP mutase family protein [Lutispora sp.]|uniref:isocitrate lyase/PEP mutase family protein n=1 Tax=Lutispora sp. TaxID=2828727 RepID=UPI002B201E74|nr:isocitrate lyase/phosphoenolpyruvate mutase family protein [Lutispora sp.]MEA4962372.1 isocitrate lyase/phosphoenolpyruvate mutase family protein [Lutispora sp.]
MERKTTYSLKEILEQQNHILVPGIYDALTAKLAEEAGFSAVFLTGYGVSAARLGKPDLGLIHGNEIANVMLNISNSCRIPVIADADTGYGGPLNVIHTLKLYEQAGTQAIQLEDQQWPKRCGHIEGKRVISTSEMVAKIKAAADARENKNMLIIARTDSIAVEGFSSAIRRCESYLKAGADCLFVESPIDREQTAAIPKLLPVHHVINMAETGKAPAYTSQEVFDMGYNIALYPITVLLSAVKAAIRALVTMRDTGSSIGMDIISYSEFNQLIGMTRYKDIDKQYMKKALELEGDCNESCS